MRRISHLVVVLTLCLSPAAWAQELIRVFDVELSLAQDGTLDVTETIAVDAQGVAIVHGIYRDFPRYITDAEGTLHKVRFDVLSVERDGELEPWNTETIEGGTRLRIGEPDEEIVPGEHVYRIEYITDQQVTFGDRYDRLLWNVTGNGWDFPIESVRARMTLPDGAVPEELAVYTGAEGETGQDATADIRGNSALFATNRKLDAYEGLTIDMRLPKAVISPPTAVQRSAWWWRDNLNAVIALVGLLGISLYFLVVWFRVGREPKSGVSVPRWDLPEGISPALARYIMERGFPMGSWTAMSASAIDLSVKGYTRIEDLGGTFQIRRTDKPLREELPTGQAVLLEALDDGSLPLDRAHGEEIAELGNAFHSAIEAEHKDVFFRVNRGPFLIGFLASLVLSVVWGLLSGLGLDILLIVALSCAAPMVMDFVIWRVVKERRRKLSAGGRLSSTLVVMALVAVLCAMFIFGLALASDVPGAMTGVIMGWGLVVLNQLFFILNTAATSHGRSVRDHLLGLRLYLGLAEQDRMNMVDAPEMSPQHFETLLPYAIVLGVERPWRKRFDTWFSNATADYEDRKYMPVWYAADPSDFDSGFAGVSDAVSNALSASAPLSGSFGSGSSGSGGGGGGGGGW